MKKKKTVTLPRTYNPGKGHPKETLAYLSPAEHELIRKLTDGKWNRGPKGVKSYADDSASSKGVSRGDSSGTKGSGGLGQGGQGAGGNSGSKASSSPSGGVSTGGGLRGAGSNTGPGSGRPGSGSSAASSAASGGQRGAGSNYGPGSGRPGSGGTFGGVAKAAQDNAARASGNVSNPVSYSGSLDRGLYHSLSDSLPGQNNPTQFDRTISPTNMVNSYHVPMDKWLNGYNPNNLTAGAQKIHQAITDSALRRGQPVDFLSGARPFNKKSPTVNHPSRQAIDIRMVDPMTGRSVGYDTIGPLANNPIGSVNPSAGRGVKEAVAVQGALEGPYRSFATDVLSNFTQNPGVYGEFNNQRWGGAFGPDSWKTDRSAKDYMHFDEGKVTSAVSRDQAALRNEVASYSPPNQGPGIGGVPDGTMVSSGSPIGPVSPQRPNGVQVAGIANAGLGEADRLDRARKAAAGVSAIMQGASPLGPMQGPNMPPQGIPAPNSIGMMRSPYSGYGEFSVPPAAPKAPTVYSNERTVSPKHWGREEVDYLTKTGAMDRINRDPLAAAGYKELQMPDGSGLRIGSDTNQLGMTYPGDNMTNVRVSQSPTNYGDVLAHELGHVGSYRADPEKFVDNMPAEEIRQYGVDARLDRPDMRRNAEKYLEKYGPITPLGRLSPPKPAGGIKSISINPADFAKKPQKEIQLAWNVPPIGGALPPQTAWGLGQWGTYREKPKGPAANPGTIHSQTADAAPAAANTSQWSWDDLRQAASTKVAEVQKQIDDVKKTPMGQFAINHPKLAAFGLKMMMGGGGNPNSTLGTAQDRANYRMAPPQPPQQMAQAEQMPTDPLGTLNSLLANMIAKGAKPEEIAYVQSIINELTKTQVA